MCITREDKIVRSLRVAGRASFQERLVARFAVCVKVAEPPASSRGVLCGVLDHKLNVGADPGTKDWSWRPKTLLFSSEGTKVQCKAAMIAPSGNGSFPSRYALIATSLPKTAEKLFSCPSSCATEMSVQSRYPGGIFVTKIRGCFAVLSRRRKRRGDNIDHHCDRN
jgi:hypothetical protein